MKPLRDNFREGAPISQVPATWFNAVASFINSLIPGRGIIWAKSESMNVIEVDPSVMGGSVRSVNNVGPDANGNVALGDLVQTVDGHSPDSSGDVSFGLTSDKFVKTNSNGHLTTTNDKVVTIASNLTGRSSTFTVVTDVVWNGTTLQKKTRSLTFSSGVLTAVGGETTTTIDTPVPYTTS